MRLILCYLVLILTFLSAAKSHGRQYRLEREMEGHWQVSFTSTNHPWVERLWLRQRILYWSIVSLFSISFALWRWLTNSLPHPKWHFLLFVLQSAATSMIVAFFLSGLTSLSRLFIKLRTIPPPSLSWLDDAKWGSLGWWILTAILAALLLGVGRQAIPCDRPGREHAS